MTGAIEANWRPYFIETERRILAFNHSIARAKVSLIDTGPCSRLKTRHRLSQWNVNL